MKAKTLLLAVSLTAFAASTAFANEEHHTGTKNGKAEAVKEHNDARKPMKRHGHMEEKTGMPAPAAGMDKNETMMNAERHDHTKDKR